MTLGHTRRTLLLSQIPPKEMQCRTIGTMEKKKTVSVKVNFDNALLTFLLMISCASCPSVDRLGNRMVTPIRKEKAGSKKFYK